MKKIRQQSAFTLIETLVAIAILMVSIAGPLDIAQKALTSAVQSRDQIIATYLAQDLMEYVKNVRDDNVAQTPSLWLNYLSGCTNTSPCIAETATGNPASGTPLPVTTAISPSPCNFQSTTPYLANSCRLYIDMVDTPGQYYTYVSTGNQPTQFYRYFTITQPSGADTDEALLTVYVYWYNGTILGRVSQQTLIFNVNRI